MRKKYNYWSKMDWAREVTETEEWKYKQLNKEEIMEKEIKFIRSKEELEKELEWYKTYSEFINVNYPNVCGEASSYADGDYE